MAAEHWSHPSPKEQAWIDHVLNPAPEPPQHRCGKCRNPWTGGREDCPNNRRT